MSEITTYEELFAAFCKYDPETGSQVIDYQPWGRMSIVIWLDDLQAYKVKLLEPDKFVVQHVSQADIEKKLGTKRKKRI